ncbi:nuclease SbcCD subunit C [Actinomadura sp. NBRC 104412]|uniref:AAA family ATPase n=1 Tax=Actinomadura sp. NBRC 104412 TaxID=3032203 RepID=UPI0024A5A941|nr:SMC family ATPase [Actinomadura sp. NBRC 104412]GLZ04721.1 nuclease SbcCD subunit C [Actinomadura sp. NBRC 104412]
MRLHRLRISAFGPFAGTEEIDFDVLSEAGLFLVHGETGAGKTSVLDAVCFALYGRVPGARGAVKGLRSDHAAADVEPRVVLETTIRGRRLRISRSPEWERPKRRGTGTTRQHATALLEEFRDGAWTPWSNRIDEVSDQVGRLLGMTATQFCQVAMLPQGEFASFLRAGADERRKVLERLFAAEVFTQVEKWLAERRAATGRDADALRAAAVSLADRIAETTGDRRPGGDTVDAGDVEALPAWAAELAGQHAAILASAEEVRARAAEELTARREALDEARVLADAQRRHAEALRRRDALLESAEERARLTSRLDAAARADRVLPLVRNLRDRAHRAKAAHNAADLARSRVAALAGPNAAEDVLAKAERARRDDIAALDGRRASARRLADVTAQRGRLTTEREALEQREARAAATLEDLPAVVDEQRAAYEAATLAAASRPGAQAAVEQARTRLGLAQRRDELHGGLAEAEDAHRQAVDAAQAARDRFQELRQARLEGMAATLAQDLVDGEPCLVCGSPDHPSPAPALGVVPGEDDEERARVEWEQAQELREETGRRVESVRADLDAKLEAVGEAPLGELAAEVEEAERALADALAAEDEVGRLEAALHDAERELERARDERDEIARSLAANAASDSELAAEQARLESELDEARGDDPSIEARMRRLGREADALAEAARALRDADTASAELSAARAEARAAARNQGFRDPDEAAESALDDEEQAALRDRIRRFDDQEAAVRSLLADPALKAAAEAPAPDLPALESALAVAEARHTAVASAAERARRRGDRLAELRRELSGAVREWRPAAERHRVAARLAGLASGKSADNRRGMSLSAYVLAARLEQVVAAANERLDRMSSGRYALEHTTDRAAGDRGKGAGGLGLRVLDRWTGCRRDPVTLSGGESFVTSLALALGLAGVVTAEAGGTEINTLFVDEGFGTLDEQTLDEVMDVLDGLRDGGRAVGIVSHVAELRSRIPVRLRVTKTRGGSVTAIAH